MAKETIVTKSRLDFQESLKPAITIWKEYDLESMLKTTERCGEAFISEYTKMLQCVENSTASLNDTVLDVTVVDSNNKEQMDMKDLWRTRFGIAMEGRRYTMKQSYPLSDEFYTRIVLPDDGNFTILIHDPHYFVDYTEKLKEFPNPFPIKLREEQKSTINLDITHEIHLSKQNNQCNMDKSYSFIECTQV